MKQAVLLLIISLLAVTPGCKKMSAVSAPNGTYKGVVVFNICGNIMIQTLGPDYLGVDTWVAGSYAGAPVYHHVFAVQNSCQFGNSPGDTITFKVVAAQPQNCMHCMAVAAVPDVSYPIEVIN